MRRTLLLGICVALLVAGHPVHAQNAYAGVWRAGNDPYYLWIGSSWTDFENKWKALSNQNLRLVDIDIYPDGSSLKFLGVWRGGNDAHYLWVGDDWNGFKAKWEELSKQNLRLTVVKTYVDGGKRRWAGVWRAGNDAHYLWAGATWNDFKAKWDELSNQGLRLVDVETYVDGGTRRWVGVWRAGNDAHYLWAGVSWNDFKAKWDELGKQNLRLTRIRTYEEGGQRKWIGVWRAGSDGYYLWVGGDYENFTSKWHELAGQGLRLVSVTTYPGCGNDCANQVVSDKAYDYYITGHNTGYHWPVDVSGSDKFVRLSALEFDAKPFVLPFSNTSVKRWNGWRYSDERYHHAVDYAIDLAQTFQIKAAAEGKVVFIGWDNWSGNTIVVSHDVGGGDTFRTIYMHMRNGPAADCANAWTNTVPSLNGDILTAFKAHLDATGCTQNAATRNPTAANWGTDAQKIAVTVGQHVNAGQVLGWTGDTGPGGNGGNNANTNTHLHIFFTRRDPTNNQFYFIDPYGIYAMPNCYPAATTGATGGVCARYPTAWKGGAPQYP